DASVRDIFFAGAIRSWKVVIPDFGTVTGPFQITALEFAGDHDGEITFDLALESAGEVSFASA
ncbi:phage major tail protein, TP901-1 family, partial [Escherichia coli]|uniref:phage major tail protein, TP901-1 family n=1 Tax=Escherichia coli TaxID=562 RepID=UPI001E2E37A7